MEEEDGLIVNVWADNLDEEMAKLQEIVAKYPYIAMDTEFPGVVAKPIGQFRTASDFQYQQIRCNVEMLKLIQLGLAFFDANGNRPPGPCCWQFNFHFDLDHDMYAKESIDLLLRSGINFDMHRDRGIHPTRFAEMMMASGMVLDDAVTWITFHSGYDFGYLLRLLMNQSLPTDDKEFLDVLQLFFPSVYDVKYMSYFTDSFKGSLKALGQYLNVYRIGIEHQAGSDSLLTAFTFFKLRERQQEKLQHFPPPGSNQSQDVAVSQFCNLIFGLGKGYVQGSEIGYGVNVFTGPSLPNSLAELGVIT